MAICVVCEEDKEELEDSNQLVCLTCAMQSEQDREEEESE